MDESAARFSRLLTFLETDATNLKLRLDCIRLASELDKVPELESLVARGLELHPDQPDLLFSLASHNMRLGDFATPVAIFGKLIDNGVDNSAVRYNLAYCHLYHGNKTLAQEALAPVVEAGAESLPQAFKLMARINHHLGDLESANTNLERYLQLIPDESEALGLLALAKLDQEQWDIAKGYAEQVYEQDATNLEAMLVLGTECLNREAPSEAKQYLEKAAQLHPRSGRSWMGLGLASMAQQDVDAAVTALEKAVSLMDGHIGTWHALAWCYLVKNDLDKARETFERSLMIDRRFGETYGGLAVIQVLLGETESAKENIKRALGLDKSSFSAQFARTLMLAMDGRNEKAEQIIQRLLDAPIDESGKTLKNALVRLSSQA